MDVGRLEPLTLHEEIDRVYRDAIRAHQDGRLDLAERGYREVVEADPVHAGAWHFLGVIRLASGDLDAACKYIEQALSLCDTKPVYWNNYGAVLLEMGEHRRAETAFRRALDLNGDYADAWGNLGHSQQLLGLPPAQMEQSYRNALTLAPNHVDVTFRLADFYEATGRHADAVVEYRRGLKLAPDHPAARRRFVGALVAAKQWEEAEQVLGQALARNPNDLESRVALAAVQAGLEDVEGARRAYGRVASLGARPPTWKWKHLGACPTVFPNDEAVDRYWARLEKELNEALTERMFLDWRALPRNGYTPPFNLPHHGRCCREVREMFSRRFEPAFPRSRFASRKGPRIRERGCLDQSRHRILFWRNGQTQGCVDCRPPDRR